MKYWMLARMVVAASAGVAQAQGQQQDLPIDAAQRAAILDGAAQRYDSLYVFADRGREIKKQLSSKAVRQRYALCNMASCLADSLTKDLQQWSGDKHLRLVFSVRPRPMPSAVTDPAAAEREREMMRQRNFGFHNIERLHGNIGLIELGRFDPAQDAAETAAAAMRFVANTDALIIDLRNNGGGRADMVAHLMSYFVNEATHLGTMKRRKSEDDVQFWTAAHVPAPRYVGKPIYVLTSKRTFSAAEGLTYDLQQHANAIVIGETTRGGANPGSFEQINEHFAVFVPTGQTVNAKTHTNWDGVGIKPDHEAAAADAVKVAHKLALQTLVQKNDNEARISMWRQALEELFPEVKTSAK